MKDFKFLSKNNSVDLYNAASWDFVEDYNGEIGNHRIEIAWFSSFIEFLTSFEPNEYVLVDVIKIPFDDETHVNVHHGNYDLWHPQFIEYDGRVRVSWLNFDIM